MVTEGKPRLTPISFRSNLMKQHTALKPKLVPASMAQKASRSRQAPPASRARGQTPWQRATTDHDSASQMQNAVHQPRHPQPHISDVRSTAERCLVWVARLTTQYPTTLSWREKEIPSTYKA